MPYTSYGWLDAPDGWQIGDAIPGGYETSEINAENLEAFGAHVLDQAPLPSVNTVLYDSDLGEWPARPSDSPAISYLWIGPTFPEVGGTGEFRSNVDVYVPSAEVEGGGQAALEWTKATLESNWTHLVDAEAGYYYVQYARDGDQLHLRGVAASTTGGTTVLVLPDQSPRVRPLSFQVKTIWGDGGLRALTFNPNGTISLDVRVGFVYLDATIWLDIDPAA